MTCLKRLNDNLGVTLSNVAALEAKVRYYSWNVKGPQFHSARQLLKMHHSELSDVFDRVVTSVFLNGYEYCFAGFKHMASMAAIDDGDVNQEFKDLISDLLASYSVVLVSIEKAHYLAEQQGNHAVIKLMVEVIAVFKEHMWHLRSLNA